MRVRGIAPELTTKAPAAAGTVLLEVKPEVVDPNPAMVAAAVECVLLILPAAANIVDVLCDVGNLMLARR